MNIIWMQLIDHHQRKHQEDKLIQSCKTKRASNVPLRI